MVVGGTLARHLELAPYPPLGTHGALCLLLAWAPRGTGQQPPELGVSGCPHTAPGGLLTTPRVGSGLHETLPFGRIGGGRHTLRLSRCRDESHLTT